MTSRSTEGISVKSRFLYEGTPISKQKLSHLGFSLEEISHLRNSKIVKKSRSEDILNFVGILNPKYKNDNINTNYSIIVLPKYLHKKKISKEERIEHISYILKALRKYKTEDKKVELENNIFLPSSIGSTNAFSLAEYLIKDYLERGIYRDNRTIFSEKNSGRIDWKRTIESFTPIKSNNTLFYPKTIKKKRISQEHKIISNFHKYALKVSIEKFGSLLGYSFNADIIPTVENMPLIKEVLRRGEQSRVYYELIKELRGKYGSRDIKLLRNLINFISPKYSSDVNNIVIGIRNYELLWERMVMQIFDPGEKKNTTTHRIKENFSPPSWRNLEHAEITTKKPSKSIPDTISKVGKDFSKLIIIDSKYYHLDYDDFNGLFEGSNPRVNDVIKQIAYEEVIRSHNLKSQIVNVFMFPEYYGISNNKLVKPFGTVFIPGLETKKPIINCLIDTNLVLRYYVQGIYLKKNFKRTLFDDFKQIEVSLTDHLQQRDSV